MCTAVVPVHVLLHSSVPRRPKRTCGVRGAGQLMARLRGTTEMEMGTTLWSTIANLRSLAVRYKGEPRRCGEHDREERRSHRGGRRGEEQPGWREEQPTSAHLTPARSQEVWVSANNGIRGHTPTLGKFKESIPGRPGGQEDRRCLD